MYMKILTILIVFLLYAQACFAVNAQSTGPGTGSGTGDVSGPASATDGAVTCFDGTTGKSIDECDSISGITSFTLPNGVNPTTDATAEIAYDSDDFAYESYDGTNSRFYATRTKCESFPLLEPDTAQGVQAVVTLKHFVAEQFPGGVTVEAIHISTSATCTDDLSFEEWSNNGTAWSETAVIEAITLSGTHTEDDGTLADAAIAADSYIRLELDATTPCDIGQMTPTVCYQINENN
jgi:hypothetical protein